jgi:hypothetical protein
MQCGVCIGLEENDEAGWDRTIKGGAEAEAEGEVTCDIDGGDRWGSDLIGERDKRTRCSSEQKNRTPGNWIDRRLERKCRWVLRLDWRRTMSSDGIES